MPLKGLRPNRSQKDLKRRSTLDAANIFRYKEQPSQGHLSSDCLSADSRGASEDGVQLERRRMSVFTDALPSPPIQEDTPNTKRFSMLKFRHASDSQLFAKAKEQATERVPPVPTMPGAPAIITTAPAMEMPPPHKKKRIKFQPFTRQKSTGVLPLRATEQRPSNEISAGSTNNRTLFGSRKGHRNASDDQGRFSVGSAQFAASENGMEATSTLAPPLTRESNSSRLDASSTEHVSYIQGPPVQSSHTGNNFPWLRKNRHRASLFPLPVKIPPPEFPNTAPATPRASTSAVSSGSPNRSPGHDIPNPLPSPSHTAFAGSSISFAAPGSTLLRHNSTTSARSTGSSPALAPPMLKFRNRSSTAGSLGGGLEDIYPGTPPPINGSGRNSSSTNGRNSFSRLLELSRLRHSSDQQSLRHSSPGPNQSFNVSTEHFSLPERQEGETPLQYLERAEKEIDSRYVALTLSKRGDDFSLAVLRSYMRKFSYFGEPMDMSLRKFLMAAELPKETEQHIRFLEGFADRYHECNPGIFVSADQAFFICYSMIMLQTDHFNANVKNKMTKEAYIKNTLEKDEDGNLKPTRVSEDILGYFYDNLAYTQFLRSENPDMTRKSKRTLKNAIANPVRTAAGEPLDPYPLIMDNKIDVLRPQIKDVMDLEDPYSYLGTAQSLDMKGLVRDSKFGVLQIMSARSRPEAFVTPATADDPHEGQAGVVDLPVDKVGILWRKDPKKRKGRSPWQEWGAILTGSGLCFFKNASWVKNLVHQYEQHQRHGHGGSPVVFTPPLSTFKAEQLLDTKETVALLDRNYKKHKNAFHVLRGNSILETFLADNESEMNNWLARLNYHAAFKTADIRQRGLIGSNYEGQRQRAIRRLASSNSAKSVQTPTGEVLIQSGKIDDQLAQQINAARKDNMQYKIEELETKLAAATKELDKRLRDARHLQILTPIQQKTREQVVHAAGRMAAAVNWNRIGVWRLRCHRDVLTLDLEEETKMMAGMQARNQVIGEPAASTSLASPPNGKPFKPISLNRLNSRASTAVSVQNSPQSPTARPNTMSSQGTDYSGEEIFKTPPEQSTQPSPTNPHDSWTTALPGIDTRPGHRTSMAITTSSTQSPSQPTLAHQPSTSSIQNDLKSPSTLNSATTTADDPAFPNAKPPTTDARPLTATATASDSDLDAPSAATLTGSPQSRTRVRRSLHRTLREAPSPMAHHHHHRRGGKDKDSVSSAHTEDTSNSAGGAKGSGGGGGENEVLARPKGSFTVHGKTASVITFGPEWSGLSTEERLRLRKQGAGSEEAKGGGLAFTSATAAAGVGVGVSEDEAVSPASASVPRRDGRSASLTSHQSAAAPAVARSGSSRPQPSRGLTVDAESIASRVVGAEVDEVIGDGEVVEGASRQWGRESSSSHTVVELGSSDEEPRDGLKNVVRRRHGESGGSEQQDGSVKYDGLQGEEMGELGRVSSRPAQAVRA